MVPVLALAHVPGADPDRLELVEHVDLGEHHRVDAVGGDRVARHRRVEPSDAARAPGRGAVLGTDLAELVAERVRQLGGKRPVADPRRVRLEDPHGPVTRDGGMPLPVHAPPAVGDEDVTYG